MSANFKFSDQFNLKHDYYLKHLDFLNWYRYYFIIKEVLDFKPSNILELGSGSGLVKNCLHPLVKKYIVMDINPKLKPDSVSTAIAKFISY